MKLDLTSLRDPAGLQKLDAGFLEYLGSQPELKQQLLAYRETDAQWSATELSEFLIELAPHLEGYLGTQFSIETELASVKKKIESEQSISIFKKEFVLKRARRYKTQLNKTFTECHAWLKQQIDTDEDLELAVARYAVALLDQPDSSTDAIERLVHWCVTAQRDADGIAITEDWASFNLPRAVDPAHLVPLQREKNNVEVLHVERQQLRQRDGFTLTDPRMERRAALNETHYCVFCHDHDGDFCSKGFPEKKKQPELGLKVNALGVKLTGCPLEEKISEMHYLMAQGQIIAALATAMIDNPMLPATGHRICNDCMKACIYQKQDPVNIPQIETRILTEVLALPWGVEIYDLLTRWNPLRKDQCRMQPYNGRNVLITGMGPAGFTMAHHLTMTGCAVVGIDGLKIEPLPQELLNEPIRDYNTLCESLNERIMAGFGGVAEYGITVRWDKNFLKLIYLSLARRKTFQVFGGVRLGGTLTLDDAWRLGFDHVCIANGAGLPRVIHIGNSLARGMRQANDFLMALQLTGAAKADSLANLQVRLPAVVIGGGLTAIDTATEVQAYYVKQVEKVLMRFEGLVQDIGEDAIRAGLDEENNGILDEYLAHGRAVRAERARAEKTGEQPDLIGLLRSWGGVTIVYRRSMNESPAYLRNHEEIGKAMEEGIYYAEGLEPVRAELDQYKHVQTLVCRRRIKEDGRWLAKGKEVSLPARAILVAAGTFPNTIYENEYPGTFAIENNHFLPHVAHRQCMQPVQVAEHSKSPEFGPFTSYDQDQHRVSFIGDAHPVFNGSVVKAIASAARSYPEIVADLECLEGDIKSENDYQEFRDDMNDLLVPRIERINDSHPTVIELWIKAPMAARNFRPGQFVRLQTFESLSDKVRNTRLQIPLQTISGAGVGGDTVRLLLLRFGMNAKLAARLKPGDPVILMGPTGAPNEIPKNKNVLVVAGSWGAAVMLGLGPALKAQGNKVLYFASYPTREQLYYQEELEQSADQIIWSVSKGDLIQVNRDQDVSVENWNVIELLQQYDRGELDGGPSIPLKEVDQVLVMGTTGLLDAFQNAIGDGLRDTLREGADIIGTVGSPMQCMLKGVCAQCLQWQIDPETGERTRAVFSCSMQDQPLLWIDVDNLAARQAQNRLQEHLTNLWVDQVLKEVN